MVHLTTYQQSPNTKTEAGKMLETWLKLDMVMVQSPQDLSQWLLVVGQIVEQRKFISERYDSTFLISKYAYGAVGFRLFGKPNLRSNIIIQLPIWYRVVPC